MAESQSLKPTRTRHWIFLFAVTLAMITYIDRVCMSLAIIPIQRDLGLSDKEKGMVLGAFGLAYALFEIPTGWWGDLIGPRRVLIRVVMWWSFFTAATGAMWSFVSLWITRFLFGAGEAGCFPNLTKIYTTWLPPRERVRAQGINWLSARWGGSLTPLMVGYVFSLGINWRGAFMIFGMLGVIWAFFFARWFKDNPADHPKVNAAELALLEGSHLNASGHGDVPWKTLFSSLTMWMLWLQYFALSYAWYFFITWMPTYLEDHLYICPVNDPLKAGILSGLPLFLGGVGCLLSGFISNWLDRVTGSHLWARRILAMSGLAMAGLMFLLSSYMDNPILAAVALGLASFGNDLAVPAGWASCMDVGGRFAGTVSGSMNMMGNLAGFVFPVAIPYIHEWGNFNWSFTLSSISLAYIVSFLCWLLIDPVTPLRGCEAAAAKKQSDSL